MTCNMDLLNLTSIVKPVKETNLTNIQINTNNEFSNKYEEVLGTTKEDFFAYCTSQKINTLDSYINAHPGNNSSRYSLTKDDYKAEYSEYMKSRGCDNQAELTALNSFKSYSLTTKQQLLDYAGILAEQASATLYGNGFTSERVMDSTSKSLLMSNASLQDIADYANAFDSDQSPAGGISSFKSFIDKVASTSGVDEGLKTKLVQMSKEISNSSDAIAEFCDKIEKQAETQRKLDSEFEIQKYNVS